ncbi:unnamed protein product [Hymenolepis diminuta]|uniref:Uncharacterized protein n=1 Tax=Hymenolepis diminuta TaxID=6216 RepID=A0A0R3SMT6_HYMDI|nr:unnamed protein product [Hymenolepis diminuta]
MQAQVKDTPGSREKEFLQPISTSAISSSAAPGVIITTTFNQHAPPVYKPLISISTSAAAQMVIKTLYNFSVRSDNTSCEK